MTNRPNHNLQQDLILLNELYLLTCYCSFFPFRSINHFISNRFPLWPSDILLGSEAKEVTATDSGQIDIDNKDVTYFR